MAKFDKINDAVEMDEPEESSSARSSAIFFEAPRPRWMWAAVALGSLLCIVGLICIIMALSKGDVSKSCTSKSTATNPQCQYSPEAKRVNLEGFFKEAQSKYFEMNPDNVAWQPGVADLREHVKSRFYPYNPDPKVLKQKTEAARELLKIANNMDINTDTLKPREAKAMSQMKHFLQHTFGVPYDENYYAGDWMLGPNLFCWMPICSMQYDVNAWGINVKPVTYGDVEYVIDTILKHKKVIDQYRKNVALGVTTGMVRTKIDCRAGVDAMKQLYTKMTTNNDARQILNQWFTKTYQRASFLAGLQKGVEDQWQSKHEEKNISVSIKDALVEGLGQPMLDLINYLDGEHMRNCLPNDVSSGLGGLPVDYVYTDGVPDKNNRTTKKLPTGELLNGTNTYRLILSYFTTTDISPEKIYQEGLIQLNNFYSQIINITKEYTGKSNETEAVTEFKQVLNSSSMWHNNGPFPINESNKNAYKKCISPDTAKKYCPVRWAAIQRWAAYCRQVMGMLYPKLTNLFHFTGPKTTAPNCPIKMTPHYNPSNGAQFFRKSDTACSRPAEFGLPFFLKDYGPVFQEWSVTAHEARPGHHTQIQGLQEHFQDTCGGVPKWLDGQPLGYAAFIEGWALYSENPVIADDTDTYKDNLLQKYGMLKWQVWRAVRLIVDTGLHARGMTRIEALKMFEDYAWDTSDFAVKEVTRYQSDPGQATAYMLGRLELIKMRRKTEKLLGSKFSLKDFHYQVLKQGSAPLEFLHSHIDRYIKCTLGELDKEACQYINPTGQGSITASSSATTVSVERAPRPPIYNYI